MQSKDAVIVTADVQHSELQRIYIDLMLESLRNRWSEVIA